MDSGEIAKKVQSVVIQTKKALTGERAGFFCTRSHGSGYDFDQLREYQQGDDVRFIDWKSSARTNSTLIREYKDEKSRFVYIILDVSGSLVSGTSDFLLSDVMAQISAALVFVLQKTDDSIGMHFVNDVFEMSIPPLSSNHHVKRLLTELYTYKIARKKTDLGAVLKTFGGRYRRRSLLFIISDFIDEGYEIPLKTLAQQHEVVVIRLRDYAEIEILKALNSFMLEDSETGKFFSKKFFTTDHMVDKIHDWRMKQDIMFKQFRIPCCDCFAGHDHMNDLIRFLRRYFQ